MVWAFRLQISAKIGSAKDLRGLERFGFDAHGNREESLLSILGQVRARSQFRKAQLGDCDFAADCADAGSVRKSGWVGDRCCRASLELVPG